MTLLLTPVMEYDLKSHDGLLCLSACASVIEWLGDSLDVSRHERRAATPSPTAHTNSEKKK